MIHANVFAERWRVLLSRFNRDIDPDEANRYFRYLNPRLDTEQFVKASEKLWAESSRWPKPADFVEAAPPSRSPKLLPTELEERDPYWQPVRHILRNSKAHREWMNMLHERRERGTVILDDTGPPYYFPRPTVTIVDQEDEVGVRYVERSDLRDLCNEGRGA